MNFKQSSIIILTTFMITLIYGQAELEEPKEPEPTVELDIPICNLTDHDDADPGEDFKSFTKFEVCQLLLFTDKLYELDCYNMFAVENNYTCKTKECTRKVFELREIIYEKRIEVACVCQNPRFTNITDKEYNLDYIEFNEQQEKPEKITTLCQYINCWNKLWDVMRNEVKYQIEKIHPDESTAPNYCTKLGKTNEARCQNINNINTCNGIDSN